MSSPPAGRPTFCEIDSGALLWNFSKAREKAGRARVLAVVKADAYGHGACAVARELEKAGCDAFGTATLEEAIALRRAGVGGAIFVLAGAYPEQIVEMLEHRLTPVVHDLETLERLEKLARERDRQLAFHLKIDTGMGRLGFLPRLIETWLPRVAGLERLRLEGVLSHFSHADDVVQDYTRGQLELFREVLRRLERAGVRPRWVHLANSAAVITLPEAHFTMVRPGLMLYGIHPAPEMRPRVELRPVLSWKTRILQLKEVPPETSISYGRTFVTRRRSRIATLPVGYADGYSRLLSNRGQVLVRGRRAPVVGAVCMDLTMVDVTDIPDAGTGDEVVLIGRQGEETISAEEVASWAHTIPYEVLTSISARVPRVFRVP